MTTIMNSAVSLAEDLPAQSVVVFLSQRKDTYFVGLAERSMVMGRKLLEVELVVQDIIELKR